QHLEGKDRTRMKLHLIMIGLSLTVIVILLRLFFPVHNETICLLTSKNLKMEFVVTDAATGKSLKNAYLELTTSGYRDGKYGERIIQKVETDDEGKATCSREDNSCEDIIRTYRPTVTHFDLTWASVNVTARGYRPIKQMWLHTAKYVDKGYVSE